MGSSISSLSSALAPAFTGVSKFGTSLQQVLSRAVGIASLPLDSLNAGLTTLNNKQSALGSLNTAFSTLQLSADNLQHALDTSLLNSSVSDAAVVRADVSSGASAGTYSVEVVDLGSYSTALSSRGGAPVTNPNTQSITASATVTLHVGSAAFTIAPASASLQSLAEAINSQSQGKAQAAIVNIGSGSSPDYRLSLRASDLGAGGITLTDASSTSLISNATAGSLAAYKIDGQATQITSSSRSVTLAPGLTLTLLGNSVSGQATTVTVTDSPIGLASAFSTFAQSYNNAVDAVNQHHGQSGGALQGDSLLQSLSGVLQRLGTYQNGGPASALANYGITLDKAGHLSVDTTAFATAANLNFSALLTTLGNSTTPGFIKTATDLLNSVEDPVTGLIPSETSTFTDEIAKQQIKITDEQSVIAHLQTSLTAEISKADSAIASLESKVSYVTGLFGQYTGATNTQNNGLSTL